MFSAEDTSDSIQTGGQEKTDLRENPSKLWKLLLLIIIKGCPRSGQLSVLKKRARENLLCELPVFSRLDIFSLD